jgi:hypothetical protein
MSTEAEYRAAVADLEAAQRRLGQIPRSNVEARAAAALEVAQATARVRQTKEQMKTANVRRNAAGIRADREARAAERRTPPKQPQQVSSPKLPTPAPAPAPPVRPPRGPEVIWVVARQRAPAAQPAPPVPTPPPAIGNGGGLPAAVTDALRDGALDDGLHYRRIVRPSRNLDGRHQP